MKKVRKAVIPAAGLGTRVLPATKAMPKEMLPIVDKPAIQYIVEEAAASGKAGESVFGSIFNSLIQGVKDTDAEFTQAQYLLATGQLDNPAQVGLAAYKAEVSLSLLIQMRDRALSAYNDLRNMNI